MDAWLEGANFREQIAADPSVSELLSPEKLAESFAVERQLANVDKIFDRVFPAEDNPV